MIDAACEWYKAAGAAVIDKTPEPMRPISRPNRAWDVRERRIPLARVRAVARMVPYALAGGAEAVEDDIGRRWD